MMEYDPQRPRYSPWSQLAILLALGGVGLIAGSIISIVVAAGYLQVPLEKMADALLSSENAGLTRLLQFISTLFFMALPAMIFARIMNRDTFGYLQFNSAISGKQVFIITGIVFAGMFASSALSTVNEMIPVSKEAAAYFKKMEDEYARQVLAIAQMKSFGEYIIALIMIALLPALFEEMLFRGALQPVIIRVTGHAFAGIFITSFLFSAIHMSYYGFLPRLALGMIIGYIFYYSKNLWLSSLTHFLYNAYGVTQMYLLSKREALTPDSLKENNLPAYVVLIAAIVLFILFIFFKRESQGVISMYNFRHKLNNTEG